MKRHRRKMIAPVVITALVVLYYGVYFGVMISLLDGIWKYLLGIVPSVLAVIMIAVCIERIKEIRRGEEDDLGQY